MVINARNICLVLECVFIYSVRLHFFVQVLGCPSSRPKVWTLSSGSGVRVGEGTYLS